MDGFWSFLQRIPYYASGASRRCPHWYFILAQTRRVPPLLKEDQTRCSLISFECQQSWLCGCVKNHDRNIFTGVIVNYFRTFERPELSGVGLCVFERSWTTLMILLYSFFSHIKTVRLAAFLVLHFLLLIF